VALDALLMECVGAFQGVRRLNFGSVSVALKTRFGKFALLALCGMAQTAGNRFDLLTEMGVVAIHAIQGIPIHGCMGFVVEENFSRIGLIHQADRFLGCFDGKGGVTDDGNENKLDGCAIHDHSVLLGSHLHKFLTILNLCKKADTERLKTKELDYHNSMGLSSLLL